MNMKKVLFLIILMFFPSSVLGYCVTRSYCNGSETIYTSECGPSTGSVSVSMEVNVETFNNGSTYTVSGNLNSKTITENGVFYIPKINGYIFQNYKQSGKVITDFRDITPVLSYRKITNYRCSRVYNSSTGNYYITSTSAGSVSLPYGFDSVTLTSTWEEVPLEIVYTMNDGTGTKKESVKPTANVMTPTRSGYTFDGWYYDSSLTNEISTNKVSDLVFKTENDGKYGTKTGIVSAYLPLTLYAKWTKNKVDCPTNTPSRTISFDTNGGNKISDVSIVSSKDGNLPTPTKSGYNFEGWYYDLELTKKVSSAKYNDVTYESKKDSDGCVVTDKVTLYAKWSKKETEPEKEVKTCSTNPSAYRIIYNSNGGSKYSDFEHCSKCNYLTAPKLPTPVKKGYTFEGWYYDKALTKKVKTKYASDISYSKKYDLDGCLVQVKVNLYAKWEKAPISEQDKEVEHECAIGGPSFEVIFDTDGGTQIENYTHCTTCVVEKVEIPKTTKDGYEVEGWYYDKEFTKKFESDDLNKIEYTQLKDEYGCSKLTTVTLYVKWKVVDDTSKDDETEDEEELKKYTIIYNTNGGSSIVRDTIYYGSKTETLIEEPTREGYSFVGWYYDEDLTKKVTVKHLEKIGEEGNVLGASDTIRLYAKWEENESKVSFGLILIVVGILLLLIIIVIILIKKKMKSKEYSEIETLGL